MKYSIFLIFVLMLFGCQHNPISGGSSGSVPAVTHVYIVGNIISNGKTNACYWDNAVEKTIGSMMITPPIMRKLSVSPNSTSALANSIYVDGAGNTFISGADLSSNANVNTEGFSVIWTNSIEITLSNGISAMGISGWSVGSTPFNTHKFYFSCGQAADAGEPCYWTNTVISGVTDYFQIKMPSGIVESLTSISNNVYIAGYDGNYAVYWLNGTETTLQNDKAYISPGKANSICSDSLGNFYIGGNINGSPCYWVNAGIAVFLTNNTVSTMINEGTINSIYVDSTGNIYTCGYFVDVNLTTYYGYWKNTVFTQIYSIPSGPGLSYAQLNGIAFAHGIIYVSGVDNSTGSPCYWADSGSGPVQTILAPNAIGFTGQIFISNITNP